MTASPSPAPASRPRAGQQPGLGDGEHESLRRRRPRRGQALAVGGPFPAQRVTAEDEEPGQPGQCAAPGDQQPARGAVGLCAGGVQRGERSRQGEAAVGGQRGLEVLQPRRDRSQLPAVQPQSGPAARASSASGRRCAAPAAGPGPTGSPLSEDRRPAARGGREPERDRGGQHGLPERGAGARRARRVPGGGAGRPPRARDSPWPGTARARRGQPSAPRADRRRAHDHPPEPDRVEQHDPGRGRSARSRPAGPGPSPSARPSPGPGR